MLINDMDGDALKINTDGTANTQLSAASIVLPVQLDSRVSQTIQTHNAVSVALSGSSTATVIDCNGYDKIALMGQNDAATTWSVDIQWSPDGTSVRGLESNVLASNTVNSKVAITDVKARYALVKAINGDAALAHTMSIWAYLKA